MFGEEKIKKKTIIRDNNFFSETIMNFGIKKNIRNFCINNTNLNIQQCSHYHSSYPCFFFSVPKKKVSHMKKRLRFKNKCFY
jgi:hypothetical protein